MIGPRTGIREGFEGRIQRGQSADFGPCFVVESLQGDLADDLVAEVAPGPGGRGWRDEGYEKREGAKLAESSPTRCRRSIRECPYTRSWRRGWLPLFHPSTLSLC